MVKTGDIDPYEFQSTPPRRRRRIELISPWAIFYFNPRLREGGDVKQMYRRSLKKISIHASAKEATL